MIEFNETMIGNHVKFVSEEAHEEMPEWYPEVGTIGTIVHAEDLELAPYMVQWPKGSTSKNDRWYVGDESIDLWDGEVVE